MTKNNDVYHSVLRIVTAVCAVMLIFQSGLAVSTTAEISQHTQSYLASVIGMSAAVQPTELNEYTAALTKKERDLTVREAALREREIAVELSTGESAADTTTYVLAGILFILLTLIILNYTLDYLRQKEALEFQTV